MFEVLLDDILQSTYIYIYTYTRIHIHTHLHKVLPTIYYSCCLVISIYRKSYQQYFDILLNYKKLEIDCYIKNKEQISKLYLQ